MKKKRAMEWVAALRSGDYQQAAGALRTSKGFCCLGVACNLHAQAHPDIAAKEESPVEYMGYDDDLPPAVMQWMGMCSDGGRRSDSGYVHIDGEAYTDLAEANDCGIGFGQIADYIEKNYKHL